MVMKVSKRNTLVVEEEKDRRTEKKSRITIERSCNIARCVCVCDNRRGKMREMHVVCLRDRDPQKTSVEEKRKYVHVWRLHEKMMVGW